jgi:anti-anti-sigma factor
MASVELLTPDYGDYVVAQVRGELDIITATEFEASLNAIAAGGRCVIVDLGRLEFIDCSSLRLFGQAQELAALAGRAAAGGAAGACPAGPDPHRAGRGAVRPRQRGRRCCQHERRARAVCSGQACGRPRAPWEGSAIRYRTGITAAVPAAIRTRAPAMGGRADD